VSRVHHSGTSAPVGGEPGRPSATAALPTTIPFNRPYAVGTELEYIRLALENRRLSGNGPFTARCRQWLEKRTGARRAVLTTSCTTALELGALLADVQPGDEVIMPSFTFVSTANAFVLRGAVPVFVDLRADTLNLDETQVEAAITERTRALVVVHYAGVACEMDPIGALARRHGLLVVEDAAQGLMAAYRGRPLGSFGHLAAMSFHETKNLTSGEGGALLVNEPRWAERAEIVSEKGTDRARFFRREVDRYTWVDLGSSYLPSEITAAFLWAQLEEAERITRERLRIWSLYHAALADLERAGRLRRPVIPPHCDHNAHLYYVLAPDLTSRDGLIRALARCGIQALFHYVPLHSSPAGRRFGRALGDLPRTRAASDRLIRLPLWIGMGEAEVGRVVAEITRGLG
jgi:dTDP-4-amino-4,6-dideoxygalactose transaminase